MRYAIWNGFLAVDVEEIAAPRDEAEVCALVERARREGKHIKAVGGGHSFNDLSLGEDILVDLRRMQRVVAVDPDTLRVRVQGGVPLRILVRALASAGLALANIGAWTEQTIAGVLSTATHGTSGRHRGSLIGSLLGLRLVDGGAAVRELAGDDLRDLTLGYFGIITEVTLQCIPLYFVRQDKRVQDGAEAIRGADELLARHDFVDLRWSGPGRQVIVGRWDITRSLPTRRDRLARALEGVQLGAINRLLALLRTDALPGRVRAPLFDVLGAAYLAGGRGLAHESVWYEGLTFNSFGVAAPHEEQEFALARDRAVECLLAVREQMRGDPAAGGVEVQVRFSPAEDVRLAPNHGRETTWLNLNLLTPRATPALVERLSRLALAHGGRPHWGKIVPASTPKAEALYGDDVLRWEARRRAFDPDGLFLNDYYHRHIDLHARTLPAWSERESTGEPAPARTLSTSAGREST